MANKTLLIEQFKNHKKETLDLLDRFGNYAEADLNKRPSDGGWSAMQTIHHLILAEELSFLYVKKKTIDPEAEFEGSNLKTWYKGLALKYYLLYGGRFEAPKAVSTEFLPEYSTITSAKAKWVQVNDDWTHFIEEMPDQWANKAIYKHPRAGRLSWDGMLGFFRAHLKRHTKQMKRALLSFAFLCLALLGFSQVEAPLGCGTPPEISSWLEQYAQNPVSYRSGADTILYTRLQIHLLAKDDGLARFRTSQLLDALCRLNSDYESSKIQFFYDKPWELINRTEWWDHNELSTGIEMMLQSNVDSAINCYFVSDPAGNCGYNLPYGGVAIAHNCAAPNDHTWAHELGHALRLPHPFIGWEGKSYNYNTPTPTMLTYDYTNFHDTLDTGPTLDTAFVEFVDGSNCLTAADRLCLSAPDYISQRWPCNSMNMSTTKQKDPNGVDFYSDGTLYMSYSFDNCQSRFTDDQIAVMRASLLSEKIKLVDQNFVHQDIQSVATAVMPIGGQQVSADAVTMHWTKVPGATQYLVQANRVNASFPLVEFETVTFDTFATALNLLANKTWYYRIRPFNQSEFCTSFSTIASFFTLPPAAVNEPENGSWYVYPTLLAQGVQPRLFIPNQGSFTGHCTITDINGRILNQSILNGLTSNESFPIDLAGQSAGIYFIHLQNNEMQQIFKIVLNR